MCISYSPIDPAVNIAVQYSPSVFKLFFFVVVCVCLELNIHLLHQYLHTNLNKHNYLVEVLKAV